jgi:hypothetical protein
MFPLYKETGRKLAPHPKIFKLASKKGMGWIFSKGKQKFGKIAKRGPIQGSKALLTAFRII